jgi:RNA polymerase sigma factor (sigma-70 family)
MDERQWMTERFEEHRTRLRSVSYRMLGSLSDADDAVQETWLRLSGTAAGEVDNLGGWLTTVTARVCLNMLRSRKTRREVELPDPVVAPDDEQSPEEATLLADSIGLALLVVLETLSPAERVAFVLHDMFDLPFDEIAPLVGRTPTAARQLASRARRRVRGADPPSSGTDLSRQRAVVNAFLAAARDGDFDRLTSVLDPDVVLRIDGGAAFPRGSMVVRGADAVARQALSGLSSVMRVAGLLPVQVNGAAGVVVTLRGRPATIIGFSFRDGKVAELNAIADPERVSALANQLDG